jgi:hypothetical protein
VIVNSQAVSGRWLAAWKLVGVLPEPVAFALGRAGGRVYQRLDHNRREAKQHFDPWGQRTAPS